jgi:hypothetical protein
VTHIGEGNHILQIKPFKSVYKVRGHTTFNNKATGGAMPRGPATRSASVRPKVSLLGNDSLHSTCPSWENRSTAS